MRCSGKLTREDYDAVVVPLLDDALRTHRRLRCLVEVDSIEGITPAAAFEDARLVSCAVNPQGKSRLLVWLEQVGRRPWWS